MVLNFDTTTTTPLSPRSSTINDKLVGGEFIAYYHHGNKTITEHVFQDSTLEIVDTKTPFSYELVVTHTSTSSTDQALYDNEQRFPLLPELQLAIHEGYIYPEDVPPSLTWVDAEFGETFEFVCRPCIEKNELQAFVNMIRQCMYEHTYQKSHKLMPQEDTCLFVLPIIHPPLGSHRLTKKTIADLKVPTNRLRNKRWEQPPEIHFIPPSGNEPPANPDDYLASIQADLFLFENDNERYVSLESGVDVDLVNYGPFHYWILIQGEGVPPISHPIEPRTNPNFNKEDKSVSWNYYENDRCYSLLLNINDEEDWNEFSGAFGQCIFETFSHVPFAKSCKGNQDYVINAHENNVPFDWRDSDDDDCSSEEAEDDDFDYEDEDLSEDAQRFFSNEAKNNSMVLSYKNNSCFIFRGNEIGIFSQRDNNQQLKLSHTAKIVLKDGKNLRQAIPYLDESSILLLDSENQVSHLDLELISLAPSSKYAQATDEQTLIGISSNAVFRLDPRIDGSHKVVEDECKKHIAKTQFLTVATSTQGYIAVGTHRGDIRLFDQLGCMAKTTLPPLGASILALDISSDSRYVLATCNQYIMLFDVANQHGQLGFTKPFDSNEKPIPRLLKLRPEHVVYMDHTISFTKATFDIGDKGEKYIIASTGSYVVMWKLSDVCKGRMYDYTMQKFDKPVIAAGFHYHKRNRIIVTLEDDVLLTSRATQESPSTRLFLLPGQVTRSPVNHTTINSP
ncbi:VID27-domain-containing protein [Lichtheimia hyalospora FSU 10163]|nr:VID27-domain-containing protein [Lichtheimia hyalospora FSU 10163]